jgi:5-methylcytosine-specific restriction endonuclease McrA
VNIYIKRLDTVFSIFIRTRDSDENGICKCFCCGKIAHYKEMDCSHFVNRKHLALRWNEINCQTTCRSCNRFDEGNLPAFALSLQKKYGSDIIEKLLSQKNTTVKFTSFELKVMTDHYKELIKKLTK